MRKILAAAFFSLLFFDTVAWAQTPKQSYSVSVVPQFPALEVHRDWTPVLERLSKTTGLNFTLDLAPNIPKFEDLVVAGTPDFVYMNPYHQVMGMRAQAYVPLLRDSTPLTGILVVRKDDPIRSAHDLDGKQVAFPSPNAFGASLLIRAYLAEQEKIRITPVYFSTHSNSYRQLAVGKVAAAGGVNHTLSQEPESLRNALRVLMETPGAPPHPLSAHPRVPESVRKLVTEAMLAMTGDAIGQAQLKAIDMPSPMRADYARDYQPLEKMGLEKYVVKPAKP
ncbi:MAG: phosphate/phosphite/phosphonate ABC transporter substrate-binding protein [Rhodoferax sp.]|nr:phosphate/phosphite/phosphonate ABC transporter substrate-binding protein [Rhodoferax sp.]